MQSELTDYLDAFLQERGRVLERLAAPPHLIDLGKIKELRGIEVQGEKLVIKAMTRHYDVATLNALRADTP